MTAAHSPHHPHPTDPHTHPPLPLQMNPMFPSHLFEGEHVLSCWGESFHFPERFATKKNLSYFSADLDASQSNPRGFITQVSVFEKGFKVRGLRISIPWFPCPESDCNNYSFTPACRG